MSAVCCAPSWSRLDRTARTLDHLIGETFGARHTLAKNRTPDPLDDSHYTDLTREMLHDLLEVVDPVEERALAQALRELRRDAGHTPPERRASIAAHILRVIGRIAVLLAPQIAARMEAIGHRVLLQIKASVKLRYGASLSMALTGVDRAFLKHLARAQAAAVRAHYARREAALQHLARRVLAGDQDAATRMRELQTERAENYYRMATSVFLARLRTYGTLTSFLALEVTSARIRSALTAETCDWCRMMDGEVVPIEAALLRIVETAAMDDPEEIRHRHPFVAKGRDARGEYLYVKDRDGQRVVVARVEESAVGEAGRTGRYRRVMSAQEMWAAGIDVPPYHPHCACGLEPIVSERRVEEPPAPPARPALETIGAPRAAVDIPVRPVPVKTPATRGTEGPPVPVPPKSTVELVPVVRPDEDQGSR